MPPSNSLQDKGTISFQEDHEKITVFVSGIAGYFGRILLPYLERDPNISQVIGVDSKSLRVKTSEKIEFHQLDVRNPHVEELLEAADVLVHLAFILMRLPDSQELDEINIQATQSLCQAGAKNSIKKIVITSSVVAYGLHPDNPEFLTETSSLRPNQDLYYSRAKAINASFLDEFAEQHPQITLTRLRPCTVVGPNADPANMASLTSKSAITVRGYNPPIQLLHETDMAKALYHVIIKDLPGVFNVTSDEPKTIPELMKLRGGKTIPVPYILARAFMGVAWRLGFSNFAPEWINLSQFPLIASNSKLKSTGWSPQFTTQEAYLDLLSSHGIPTETPPSSDLHRTS